MKNTDQQNRETRPLRRANTTRVNKTCSALLEDVVDRPTATLLSAADIHDDLIKLLNYLNTNLADQRQGTCSFLTTSSQALLYAERVATYALQDYPRHVDDDEHITKLWDALHHIQWTVREWRSRSDASDGQKELAVINSIVQSALQEDTRITH